MSKPQRWGRGTSSSNTAPRVNVMGTEICPSDSAKRWQQRWPWEQQLSLLLCVRAWVAGTMDIKGTGTVDTKGTETPSLFYLVLRRAKRWWCAWLWHMYIHFRSERKWGSKTLSQQSWNMEIKKQNPSHTCSAQSVVQCLRFHSPILPSTPLLCVQVCLFFFRRCFQTY